MSQTIKAITLLSLCIGPFAALHAQAPKPTPSALVILDTDIGDDIDDAFALSLVLSSPELKLLAITTDWGDTQTRAQLTQRFLCETGREDVPVFAGPDSGERKGAPLSQRLWASHYAGPQTSWPNAIAPTLQLINDHPNEITLIAVSPLANIGAIIDKDPVTFRKLKRVVIMGGSLHTGYGDLGYGPTHGVDPEYNILMDIPSAKKLFSSGVPVYVMPLDSTQLKLDEVKRNMLFSQDTPLINATNELFYQWLALNRDPTSTFYDVMAVAATIDPTVCPATPMHIEVDDKGVTHETLGKPNALACLHSDTDAFWRLYFNRILSPAAMSLRPIRTCRTTNPTTMTPSH